MSRSALVLLGLVCAGTSTSAQTIRVGAAERARWERRAKAVTVYRDTYGISHAQGRSDPDAVFGSTYAYAEDRFPEMEPYFYAALGRSAEATGEEGVGNDVFIRALEVEKLAKQEYAQASPPIKALAEAFADGMNYYLYRHPGVSPKVLRRFEPWQVFAFYRTLSVNPNAANVNLRELVTLARPPAT